MSFAKSIRYARVVTSPGRIVFFTMASVLALFVRADSDSIRDPVNITRIYLTEKQLRAELQKSKLERFVQMSRAEFESKIRAVADAQGAKRNPPRMVKAYYSASLKGDALVDGRGSWSIFNRAKSPGVLSLPKFNLALSSIQIEGKNAILGDMRPGQFGLYVAKSGKQSVFFDWSFQGHSTAQGLHFTLLVPSCPSSTLDLTLPSNYVVKPSASIEAVSVHPAAKRNHRIWRLHCTKMNQIDFIIRKLAGPKDRPVVLAYCQSQFELEPNYYWADFKLDLEVLQFPIEELTLVLDATLKPFSVTAPRHEILQTSVAPINDSDGKLVNKKLTLVFQKPVQGRSVEVRVKCFGEYTGSKRWVAPAVQVPDAITHQETIDVAAKEGVQLERWEDGAFRVIHYDSLERGGEKMTLIGPYTAKSAERPNGVITAASGTLQMQQDLWWRIQSRESQLDATLKFSPANGRTAQIVLKIPPEKEWKLESLDWTPKAGLSSWWRRGDILTLELQPGLTSRHTGVLHLQFRSAKETNTVSQKEQRAFPSITSLSASVHKTTLAISLAPIFQSSLQNAPAPAVMPQNGPWNDDLPDYFFVFRNENVRGDLVLKSYRNRLSATAKQKIDATSERIVAGVELELRPLLGNPDHADIFITRTSDQPVRWASSVPMRNQKRLAVNEVIPQLLCLGAMHGFEPAWLKSVLPGGQIWRVTFDRPLESDESVQLKATFEIPRRSIPPSDILRRLFTIGNAALPLTMFAPPPNPDSYRELNHTSNTIPICSVINADRFQGDIPFAYYANSPPEWHAFGLKTVGKLAGRDAQAKSTKLAKTTLRYGDGITHRFPRLVLLAGKDRPKSPLNQGTCVAIELTTYVEPERPFVHHFRFAVRDWRDLTVPVWLPFRMGRLIGVKTNGVWLERFPYVKSPQGFKVELPVLDQERMQFFEVVYTSESIWQDGRLWSSFAIPAPRLPVPGRKTKLKWRLAPGLTPLQAGTYFRSRQSPEQSSGTLANFWRQADHFVQPLIAELSPDPLSEFDSRLAESAKSIPLQKGKWTLGEAVYQLYRRQISAQSSLVVDVLAMREADVHPKLALGKTASSSHRFWTDFSICVAPNSVVPLFSTSRYCSKADHFAEHDTGWLRKQLLDAVYHGTSASGRFVRADVWAGHVKAKSSLSENDLNSLLAGVLSDPLAADWSEWDSQGKWISNGHITLVDRAGFGRVGKIIAVLFAIVLWRARRFFARRVGRWFALAVVLALGVAWCLLPFGFRPVVVWPLLLAGVAWFVWAFLKMANRTRLSRQRGIFGGAVNPVTAVTATAVVLCAWVTSHYAGDSPPSFAVYFFGDTKDHAKQNALAPPSLLKALTKMKRELAPHGDEAVLLRATYKGTVEHGTVRVDAIFDCYSFSDKTTLKIPLDGVQLEEGAFLSGAPVFPVANPAPDVGFSVPVRSEGFFQLSLSFRAAVRETRYQKEFDFSIPKLAVNLLELEFAEKPAEVFVLDSIGRQTRNGSRVAANLGRKGKIHVRWHSPGTSNKATGELTRELYYWDYTLTHPNVTGILETNISSGEMRRLDLVIPDLEVREVTVYQVTEQGLERVAKTWRSFGNRFGKRLSIQLAKPVTGRLQIRFDAAPLTQLKTGMLPIRLPRLLQFKSTPKTARVFAYRLTGFEIREESNNLAVTKQTVEKFRTVAEQTGLRIAAPPTQVYHFSRRSNVAGLNLHLAHPRCAAEHELEWTFGETHADFIATVHCESLLPNHLPLVWNIPPSLVVLDVTNSKGESVSKWNRTGQTLSVWTQPSRNESKIHVRGWVKNGNTFTGDRKTNLPVIRLQSPQPKKILLRFQETHGIRVRLAKRKFLKDDGNKRYVAVKPNYSAQIHIRRVPVQPSIRMWSVMHAVGELVRWESHLQYRVRSGREFSLALRHKSKPFQNVRVEAPPGFEVKRDAESDQFVISCPENHPNRFVVKLSGQASRTTTREFSFPQVIPVGTEIDSHFLAVVGDVWRNETTQGIKPIRFQPRLFPDTAIALEGNGSDRKAWSVQDASWRAVFKLQPAPPIAQAQPLLVYQRIAYGGENGWRNTAHLKVLAPEKSQLSMRLPESASDVSVKMGDNPYPFSRQGDAVTVTFPKAIAEWDVRVSWVDLKNSAALHNVRFKPLKIVGHETLPVFGDVTLPPTYHIDQPAQQVVTLHAQWILQIAEAELEVATSIAKKAKSASARHIQAFKKAQGRLLHALDSLEMLLKSSEIEFNAGMRETLVDAVTKIRSENTALTQKPVWRDLRIPPAGLQPAPFLRPAVDLTDTGRKFYWNADGRTAGFQISAEDAATHINKHRRRAAAIWCLFMLAIALPILAPNVFWRFHAVWPELIWLTGILGCFLLGASVIGVLLIVYGVALRLFLIIRAILGRITRGTQHRQQFEGV